MVEKEWSVRLKNLIIGLSGYILDKKDGRFERSTKHLWTEEVVSGSTGLDSCLQALSPPLTPCKTLSLVHQSANRPAGMSRVAMNICL